MKTNKNFQKLQKEIEKILKDFFESEVKHPPEDLEVALKEIARLAAEAVRQGYSGLLPELKDQIGVVLEIYRLRMVKAAKVTLYRVLDAVIKVASSFLK